MSTRDPLLSEPFQPVPVYKELQERINSLLTLDHLLESYHSNVLPLIGSTGCGKSRAMLEYVAQNPSQVVVNYLSFPRLQETAVIAASWPPSGPYFNEHFFDACKECHTTAASVFLIQALLLSMIKHSSRSVTHKAVYSNGHYETITQTFLEYWNTVKTRPDIWFSIELLKLIDFQHRNEKFVIFFDEVGTLITEKLVRSFSTEDWNLFRSLRHASRNLYALMEAYYSCILIVVVGGTHSKLSNSHHNFSREPAYRPVQRDFEITPVLRPNTILPIVVKPPQLNPDRFISHQFLSHMLSEHLSLRLALSLRPLWIAYYIKAVYGVETCLIHVSEKVRLAMEQCGRKLFGVLGTVEMDVFVIPALLWTTCMSTVVSETLLTAMVECSFGSIRYEPLCNQSSQHCSVQKDVFLSVPVVDPLIATVSWDLVCNMVKDRSVFGNQVTRLFETIVFTGANGGALDLLLEPVASTILLYEFAEINSNSTKKSKSKFFDPVALEDVFPSQRSGLGRPSLIKLKKNNKILGDIKEWFVCANHTVELPLTVLRVDKIEEIAVHDAYAFRETLLKGFAMRLCYICPPSTAGFDLMIPMLSRKALQLSYAKLRTLIHLYDDVSDYLGVVKVSVKAHRVILRQPVERVFANIKNFSVVVSFTESVTATECDTLAQVDSTTIGFVGFVDVPVLYPELAATIRKFVETRFSLPFTLQ
ncbi:hypothetical protein RCL1_006856 [Eukaryota sp. TZLM3-RCL]